MTTDHRVELARIHRFDQLIRYLRDEMGWPIASNDFEELTFDYTAEELGINAESAAKIQEIKRLRPLSAQQPWGIFFVKFEPKQLPIVALRRILSQVALKKRASASAADRAGWAADDLLFVSNYGQDGERKISLAHFARPSSRDDLPTLKVLGWDSQDTPLHLDAIAKELTENLAWPQDESDADAWRQRWRSAFTLGHREVITTAERLSIRLAELAGAIRDRIRSAIAIESEQGPLTRLMETFKESLVHDLDAKSFADMYAQTISYGLLSSRIADPTKKTADDFAGHMRTSPFLRDLMDTFLKVGGRHGKSNSAGIDFDELGVADVVELLDDVNMEAVLRDFGDRNRQEDPVIHFFEGFLQAYDKRIRKDRGVFYTPQPVVSYIVRSVHELLQTQFGLEDGLASTITWGEMVKKYPGLKLPPLTDEPGEKRTISSEEPFVQILDPATGTATFLVEVIEVIYQTLKDKWKDKRLTNVQQQEAWNDYVPKHLLPRLHAYELMMAPYAIAHMKIGLKLAETGYRFETEERARVYLSNALEPWVRQLPLIGFDALAQEAAAVNEIKRHKRFTVLIGNPPYSGVSSNMTSWIDGLLKGTVKGEVTTASYYHVAGNPLGERKIWLQDDYVKFIRLSQYHLSLAGAGLIGYISNHGYFDNPTFRGMRHSLMNDFDEILILDLHGNLKKREITPDGGKDSNVFDIQQGVGIGIFIRTKDQSEGSCPAKVGHAELWGDRESKYRWLSQHDAITTNWNNLPAIEPFFLFEPLDQSEAGDYNDWSSINTVFPTNVTGIVTARDNFVIDFDRSALKQRLEDLRDTSIPDQVIRDRYFGGKGARKYPSGDSRGWKLPKARQRLRDDLKWDEHYEPILYRPFDIRQIYYVPWMVDWPRSDVMPNMLAGHNLAIISCRQQARAEDDWSQVGVTDQIIESCAISNITREINYMFPLYLYRGVGKSDGSLFHTWPESEDGRRPNLEFNFVDSMSRITGFKFVTDGKGDLKVSFGPEDILAYIYAIFHSREYRRRFDQLLKLNFPRVPKPKSGGLFAALAHLGREIISMHLFESSKLPKSTTEFFGNFSVVIEKIYWNKESVWLDKAKTTGFKNIPQDVWNFQVGSYQVCEKWLKDRKGRTLSKDDILHYQKIVASLTETLRLMGEIDQVIESHGGWPGVFQA